MAEVYRRVAGRPIQKYIAMHETVQDALDEFAFAALSRAQADLAAHHFEGHAFVELAKGRIDRYLILNDERGQRAAMSIEFGRKPGPDGKGGMQGLAILRKAVKL